jgi:hypothetical protein
LNQYHNIRSKSYVFHQKLELHFNAKNIADISCFGTLEEQVQQAYLVTLVFDLRQLIIFNNDKAHREAGRKHGGVISYKKRISLCYISLAPPVHGCIV